MAEALGRATVLWNKEDSKFYKITTNRLTRPLNKDRYSESDKKSIQCKPVGINTVRKLKSRGED